MSKALILALLSLFLLHCAKKQSTQISYSGISAPTSESQLGFIAEANAEQTSQLKQSHPQASVRVLGLNFIEVSNISEADLKSELPNSLITKNKFLKLKNQAQSKYNVFSNLEIGKFKGLNTTQDAQMALSVCRPGAKAPMVSINGSLTAMQSTINLGETVDLNFQGVAHPDVGGGVRIILDLITPMLSMNTLSKGISNSLKLKPDSVGLYRLAVIAQGKDLTCNATVIDIAVTDNPEINDELSIENPPLANVFTHLVQTNAIEAWKNTKGRDVVVAVLDSGVNYNHPGIRNNLFIKESELINQGDNDGNQLPNDFMGWDFVNGDNLPFDDEGHGSHVSGLIASPIVGVAPEAKILPVKIIGSSGQFDFATLVAGLAYAIDSDVDIINLSLGSDIPTPNQADLNNPLFQNEFNNFLVAQKDFFEKIFAVANEKNILIVTASGNGDENGVAKDLDTSFVFPAVVTAENQIVVAATAQERLTSYANFSPNFVDLAAPGGDASEPVISLTTFNARQFAFVPSAGTSMATPVTAGAAALVLSLNPDLKPREVKQLLTESGKDLETLKGKTLSGKQVNALSATEKALATVSLP